MICSRKIIYFHAYNLSINHGGCHVPQGVLGGLFIYVKAAFRKTLKAAFQVLDYYL